jgi:large subunit ribosomal protein L9
MKVVLLNNIKGIGKLGDIKEVNDGYARNFLIPRGLGKPANAGILKEVNTLKAQKMEARLLEERQANIVAHKLKDAVITLSGKASGKGKLFSSISREALAEKISVQAGMRIAADALQTEDHLKEVGEHIVHVKLGERMDVPVKILISALS